jgi:hypothetical protein
MKQPFKITELYAFVSVGEDGDEGVCGFQDGKGVWWPLVAADAARLKDWFPIAEALAIERNTEIKLLRFTVRTLLSTINRDGIVHLR